MAFPFSFERVGSQGMPPGQRMAGGGFQIVNRPDPNSRKELRASWENRPPSTESGLGHMIALAQRAERERERSWREEDRQDPFYRLSVGSGQERMAPRDTRWDAYFQGLKEAGVENLADESVGEARGNVTTTYSGPAESWEKMKRGQYLTQSSLTDTSGRPGDPWRSTGRYVDPKVKNPNIQRYKDPNKRALDGLKKPGYGWDLG